MDEIETKTLIINKYLDQLWALLDKEFYSDVEKYNMLTQTGSIKIDALGEISRAIKSIRVEMGRISDSVSLARDMNKGLKEQ